MTSSESGSIEIIRFDHAQIEVSDLERSVSFYSEIFGFRVVELGLRRLTRWVVLGNQQELFLCLHEVVGVAGKRNEGLEITHVGLIVKDFDVVMRKLCEKNVELPEGAQVNYHSSRSIYFLDPDGFKFEISEYVGGGMTVPATNAP
jgi:catechol 2,3-dioxygenase-like lactoylglutathione lyase family enzyme